MKFKHVENALFIGAASFTIGATVRWRGAVPSAAPRPAPVVSIVARHPVVSDDALSEAEALVVDNDPFRLSNRPPEVRYDPATDGVVAGSVAAPSTGPRPLLVLKAIVGGPPWQAIIDGIPGHAPGTVAEQGSAYDKLVVREVTRDSVVIQGPDTSWVLSFRKPT